MTINDPIVYCNNNGVWFLKWPLCQRDCWCHQAKHWKAIGLGRSLQTHWYPRHQWINPYQQPGYLTHPEIERCHSNAPENGPTSWDPLYSYHQETLYDVIVWPYSARQNLYVQMVVKLRWPDNWNNCRFVQEDCPTNFSQMRRYGQMQPVEYHGNDGHGAVHIIIRVVDYQKVIMQMKSMT